MASTKNNLRPGTLDLLVLKTLASGREHGYGVARHIRETSRDVLQVEEGSLYPALHRLVKQGWIEAEWGLSAANRRAKFYSLTRKGKSQLKAETESWESFSGAVSRVLKAQASGS